MVLRSFWSFLLAALAVALVAALGVTNSSCSEDKGDDYYDDYYDEPVDPDDPDEDDPDDPDEVDAVRDAEDDCSFLAVVDGRGTLLLDKAVVSAASGPVPASVDLEKDGVVASSTIVAATEADAGWTATFSLGFDGSPNGPVGTELDLDGTWSITATMSVPSDPDVEPDVCADLPSPLLLKLKAGT